MRSALILMFTLVLAACAEAPPLRMPAAASPVPGSAPNPSSAPVTASAAAAAPRPARSPATGTPDDARRHLVRGTAAIEMAKTESELALAEEEFRMATEIAPEMAAAWYNIGAVQSRLGRYAEAAQSYNRYLALAPDAEDAARIRDEVIKLEFRQEQQARTMARAGLWIGEDGTLYELTLDGGRMTLRTAQRRVPEEEVYSTYTLVGYVPVAPEKVEYQLTLQGNRLTGLWSRGTVVANKCSIPAESAEVSGELQEREQRLVLRYPRTFYRAATQLSVLTDDFCSSVEAVEKRNVEIAINGPLPRGGIGVVLLGLTSWWDGGFSMVQEGWQGRLAVQVVDGSPGAAAGLRTEDEILAIDGVPVKTLTASGAVMRLRGAPGSSVQLTVAREGEKEALTITVPRVELPNHYPRPGEPWLN